jgi:hypothetical protein
MWSPSSSFMAILPARLIRWKSLSLLRRTPPLWVANMTSVCSQKDGSSGNGRMEVMVSPASSGSRLLKDRPRVLGRPIGIRQTLSV